MAFLYKLSYSSRSRYIEPKSIGKVVVAKEEGEAFFREKLNGSLEMTGDDFHFLNDAKTFSVECCQEVSLYIERTCTGGSELFWQGYFTLMDIEWDEDNTQATIKKIQVRDEYSTILSNWHKEINWLDYKKTYRPGTGKVPFGYTKPFRQTTPMTPQFNPGGSDYYARGFSFNNGILYLIRETLKGTAAEDLADVTLNALSHLLQDEVNPVTGKANYLRDVLVMQMSDAKRPNALREAITGMVTLKDVLAELKLIYNAYWFVNGDGKIQIEHISYFPHLSYEPAEITIDLTAPELSEMMEGRNKYSYQTERLKGIEGVAWSINESAYRGKSEVWESSPGFSQSTPNPSHKEFSGAFMSYADSCVPKDDKGEKTTEFKNVSLFATDWGGIINKPDTFPDQGWALVHVTNFASTTAIDFGWLPVSGQRVMNGCLSATRLYFDFGRHDCSFQYGMFSAYKERHKEIDEEAEFALERPTRTKTVKTIKTFTPIELGLCCGDLFDFSGLVKHPLANPCVINQVEYDLAVDSVEMVILAPNRCSDIPFPDYEEEDEPEEGCKPAGTLIRKELVDRTRVDSGIYYVIVSTFTEYYADGACGEYASTTAESSKPIPKRGNGPR